MKGCKQTFFIVFFYLVFNTLSSNDIQFFFFLKFNISGGISNHARRTRSESTKQNKEKTSTLDQPSSPTSKYVKETPTETF